MRTPCIDSMTTNPTDVSSLHNKVAWLQQGRLRIIVLITFSLSVANERQVVRMRRCASRVCLLEASHRASMAVALMLAERTKEVGSTLSNTCPKMLSYLYT